MFPAPQLDPGSSEPLYRQLSTAIRDAIHSGLLPRGSRVPPTRELAGQLGLNRTTVASAYEVLEQEGLLRGHVGRGSFVEGPASPGAADFPWHGRLTPAPPPDAPQPELAAGGFSFASSRPSQDLFPLDEVRAAAAEVLAAPDAAAILQLGSPHGYAPLRHYLLEQSAAGQDLLITNGCQQALDLLQRAFTVPGDAVLVEDPVYPGLRAVFARAGIRLVAVPMTPAGIDLDAFESLARKERPRLAVVTPNFQNPTGATLALPARHALLELARRLALPVVENDIYGPLRYHGDPLPSLKELDPAAPVILIRSFSKVAFPGLRVGWVTAAEPVISRLAAIKQTTDLHSDQLSQALLLRFAASGRLEEHRRRMCVAGAERLHAVLHACERHLPAGATFTRPQGGMNLWVRLPAPLDAGALAPAAAGLGVAYLPGVTFAVTRPEPAALRLSFMGLDPRGITRGVEILGNLFRRELDRARAMRAADPAPAIV